MVVSLAEKEERLSVKFTTPLGANKLIVDRVHATERLSTLFEVTVEAHSKTKDIDLSSLVGKPASVKFEYNKDKERYFSGIIGEVRQGITEDETGFSHYILKLFPKLGMTRFNQDYRAFQNKSATDMCKVLLEEYGVSDVDYSASAKGMFIRSYCVQYGESAFDFITRLWAEEGIFYYFLHSPRGDTLVVHDDVSKLSTLTPSSVPFFPKKVSGVWGDSIQEFHLEQRVVSKKSTLADYDFTTPDTKLYPKTSGEGNGGEVYRYPGNFFKMKIGESLNQIQIEQLEWNKKMFYGKSTVPAMMPGIRFTLKNHPREDANAEYVLYEVEHFLDFRPNSNVVYSNRFSCFPVNVPYRPDLKPKPRIHSNQMGIVVGPSGEEIHTDEFGRIKVQFYWDQRGANDDHSSCWIRVAQLWSGSQWGSVFIPRIGMEVIVSFFEGDPDRPVVVGCVYNGNNKPPYPLPDDKTKSTLKTNSTKDATDAFNEIRFEDKKDNEQLYIRAQKDYDQEVMKGDRTLIVHEGNETKTMTKGNYLLTHEAKGDNLPTHALHMVKGDHLITLDKGNRVVTLKEGDQSTTLQKGNVTLTVDKGDKAIHLKSGNFTLKLDDGNILIEAIGHNITLTSQSINLKATDAIAIQATGDLTLKGRSVTIEAQTQGEFKANAAMVIKGATTTVKADTAMTVQGTLTTVKADAAGEFTAGAMLTLKGSMTMIN